MAVVAVGSVCGSPGVTAFALDLAEVCGRHTLLVEADPDGGSLAARLGLAIRPGLTELAGAARLGIEADDVWRYAQPTASGVSVIAAHPASEQTLAALRAAAGHIAAALSALDNTVIIDVGRLRPGSPALGLAADADCTLVLSDNSVEAVVSLSHRARLLSACSQPLVVMNRRRPYAMVEIAAAVHQQVWGVVPGGCTRREQRSRSAALEDLRQLIAPTSKLPGIVAEPVAQFEAVELVVNG
ncbi:unannotated protein [freshwater metagenome]|uniref:Unannotated protein n=1 Tax=freshwater metagenome TaxID=449393 RepID=A0A6J7EMU2_9ZZZZ|nr:hypothetical protein [Actinomycetota bacterium]